jgi:hypothetical protein
MLVVGCPPAADFLGADAVGTTPPKPSSTPRWLVVRPKGYLQSRPLWREIGRPEITLQPHVTRRCSEIPAHFAR